VEFQEVSIDKLIPYARKLRKNDSAVARMIAAIKEYGFKIPLLVRRCEEEFEIVDGHLRVMAAKKLGMTALPVIFCDEWSEAKVKAFRLLVNRSATWAEWDEELVSLEIEELKALDFDLNLTGFDLRELDEFLFQDEDEKSDVIPEVPEIAVSRLGDLFLCDENRVLCGDATSADAVMRLLGGGKPKLMVTDPPYGISLDSSWRDHAGLNGGQPMQYLLPRLS